MIRNDDGPTGAGRGFRSPFAAGVALAALSALAFGLSTPLVERFGRGVGPFATAALLYGGACLAMLVRRRRGAAREAPIRVRHLPRLAAVALAGAVVAPACLAWGLQRTGSLVGALLLNLEAAFTVALARAVYAEPLGRRMALAVTTMVAAGLVLVLAELTASAPREGAWQAWGVAALVAATLAWALDNTLTRPLADLDTGHVVAAKALLGALLSLAAAALLGEDAPSAAAAAGLFGCGAVGYGLSLRLYLLAQRRMGAGRTASVFALAPFVGATAGWALGDRPATAFTGLAALLFALGAYLHVTEGHGHRHLHEPLVHEHLHRHDDGHHTHAHPEPVPEAHSHWHVHEPIAHDHPHAPDLHHTHRH
ncbi:MAG: EamA family transporter [Candidatus Lambdaproteobacteria bacterium]|nr:EamA family transporter [Candidatus Lambdaproteobacteria bacterium]